MEMMKTMRMMVKRRRSKGKNKMQKMRKRQLMILLSQTIRTKKSSQLNMPRRAH
jgi:hypothetical protein